MIMISTSGTFGSLSISSWYAYCSLSPGASVSALLAIARSACSTSAAARSETVLSGRKVTPVVASATGPATPVLWLVL